MRLKVNLIVLIVICLFSFWLRQTALFNDHFHNEDAAGILYSADLLLRGGLPQVDTVDMKAPGSFYIVAFWWKIFGKSMFQVQLLAVIWSILASIGMALSAYFLYQRSAYQQWQVPAKTLSYLSLVFYVLFSPNTDSMDINYNAWMITPYIWAITMMSWVGYLRDQQREVHDWQMRSAIVLAGFFIVISALMKHQGSFLFPVFLWYLWQLYKDLKQKIIACFDLGLGMLLGFLPLFAHYAYHGYLNVILKNYFLSESGWKYVKEQQLWSDRFLGLYDGFLGIALFVGLSAWLSIYTLILFVKYLRNLDDSSSSSEDTISDLKREMIFLVLMAGVSFAGVSVGWRFFKGYYLQLFVPLILIAVHPILIAFIRDTMRGFKRKHLTTQMYFIVFLIVSLCAFTHESMELSKMRKQRKSALYLPAVQSKEIGLWIKKKSTNPNDQIWVWGRWGWPVYFYSQKPSATRYFKNLGVLTTQLTNTWKRGTKPTTFEINSPWRQAIKELESNPPKWIVVSQNEGYQQFDAFKKLLKNRYKKLVPKEMGLKAKKYYLDVYEYQANQRKP